jgi:hypothetical protein
MRGEVLGKRRIGEDYLPLLLILILFIISRGLRLERGLSHTPPPPRAFAAAQAAPLSHSFCFCAHCLSFSARLASHLTISLGKMTPRGSLCTHPRPYNMSVVGVKKAKIDTIKRKQA